jgi:large subunit ribosomal protein L15
MTDIALNNLDSVRPQGVKRLGRGIGSGKGKTSGKGHKGQRARSGAKKRSGAFEGGQTPLYMRLPSRGFDNTMHMVSYDVITTDLVLYMIESKKLGKDIKKEDLLKNKLISGKKLVKLIMGKKPVAVEFKIEADKASKNAEKYLKK